MRQAMSPRLLCTGAQAGTTVLVAAHVFPQSWPAKPVHIIVPFSLGGGTDVQGRGLAQVSHEHTGQPFVVENRAGASGLIGAGLVAGLPPDGYNILFSTSSLSINATLYGSRMKIDPAHDLAPVRWLASTPLVLVAHPGVPVKSVPELVKLAKQRPRIFNSGVNTPGTASHLSAEMLKLFARLQVTIEPYKERGGAILALMRGEINNLFATGPVASAARKTGKIYLLAVTTAKKVPAFPDLPTMNTFYTGFESDNWYAIWFSEGTPKDIITKMNGMVVGALKHEKVRDFMVKEGLDPVGSTADELEALLKREISKYAGVLHRGNIKLQ